MKGGIYWARRGDEEIIGTTKELAEALYLTPDSVRKMARSNGQRQTRDGWRFGVVTPPQDCNGFSAPKEYRATNPDEDPIVGPASEIAALTGMTAAWVRTMARTGRVTNGWTVVEIVEKHGTV